MLFQALDNKQECYKIFFNGKLIDDYRLEDLTHTWAPSSHVKDRDIQYAKIWCGGKSLSEVCPQHLKSRWTKVNEQALVYLKTFKNAKVNLDDVCFYDLVPDKFLINFYQIKNQITQHVFENFEKPKNYSFLRNLLLLTEDIKLNKLNIDMGNIDFSNTKARQNVSKIKNCSNYIHYNPWGTVTGRITTEKNSFPILTLNKELRSALKPTNDLFVELDYNAAEVRVLLALLGEKQPEGDIHSWISKNVFNEKIDRESTKKKVFAWLYNPKAKNKKLNDFLDRDKIYQKYYDNGILTPYGRHISVDEQKALNYLIQSTSSDMLLKSAIRINKILNNKKSFVSFCVHDSVVIDMSAQDKDYLNEIIKTFSKTDFGKMKSSVSIGKDFGRMREIL